MQFNPAFMLGRLSSGYEHGKGRLIHAVPLREGQIWTSDLDAALCGAAPGKHSVGWQPVDEGAIITCPRCRRKIDQSRMQNRRMEDMLRTGKCVDVSQFPRAGKYYVLPGPPAANLNYCDATYERWIWSIGRRLSDGAILASLAPDLYGNKDFECLWMR